jgi:biopolymer transport protein ExbD
MAFSTQEDNDVLSEINITPLVDVMLVLLVAFIITIPALTNAVHINLPKTVQTTPPEQQKSITVTVDADSKIYLDNAEIAADGLLAALQGLKNGNPDLTLHLRADDRVPYGPVAKTMAVIERAGISKVSVLTDRE